MVFVFSNAESVAQELERAQSEFDELQRSRFEWNDILSIILIIIFFKNSQNAIAESQDVRDDLVERVRITNSAYDIFDFQFKHVCFFLFNKVVGDETARRRIAGC